jgi:hypothetical protein
LPRRRAAGTLDGKGETTPMRALVIAIAVLVILPAGVWARDGGGGRDREVRVAGTCGGGAKSKLKVKADDGRLEVEVEVEHVRRGSRWRVTLVQERRVAWRGTVRAGRSSGAFAVRRSLRDLAGADRVSFRAWGPGGVTCRAVATLAGD